MKHPVHQTKVGGVEKCTFCFHRLDEGIKNGLKPGVDREATPACVNTCLGQARYFGDLDDPASNVSILIAEKRGFQLKSEFGTHPQVYYLPARQRGR
jgi:phenylacetyl-CoA:acceptor oxidoreductase subunit 1